VRVGPGIGGRDQVGSPSNGGSEEMLWASLAAAGGDWPGRTISGLRGRNPAVKIASLDPDRTVTRILQRCKNIGLGLGVDWAPLIRYIFGLRGAGPRMGGPWVAAEAAKTRNDLRRVLPLASG
jgi:hypothetical protein